ILYYFQGLSLEPPQSLREFLANSAISNHLSMITFFEQLSHHLNKRVIIIIDEFDGIPTAAVSDFLYALRRIYLSNNQQRCPYSLGIIGVKNITQLNYDRSISPFNIQDDFALANFTFSQVKELFGQYSQEAKQAIEEAVIENVYQQTVGQPFLVNRLAQILTTKMEISGKLKKKHFELAHQQLLDEQNVHLAHLTTNIRQNPRFESLLMGIISYDVGIRFNLRHELISELATYGVLKKGGDSLCEIANPIYQYCIVQTFQPLINGLERQYLPEETEQGFFDYLTQNNQINMPQLLKNFSHFIARAGYQILQVPKTPQEFIGQTLLFSYLDTFVRQIHGFMYLEVSTGRGRMDLIILHQREKYIVETKIWQGKKSFMAGQRQLAKYLKLEQVKTGYYVVFDHRVKAQAQEERNVIEGCVIFSYVIPVLQKEPSNS
ncbi:AAA-like domain-containing protein, partial [Candidatus Marithioploca araucensis]|nr:AAA-like domain-containing protein [Candidatus Marithioploca araucensis]